MKGKDGQTSIFLIIGIVLVIVVMIALIMRGPQNKLEVDNEIKKIDIRDIKFYLEECISDEVKMMIPMVISESGLYTKGRNETINLKNKSIGYYLFHDNLTVPNSSQIANMIRFFALDITSYCVLQFEEVQRFEDNWVNYYEVEVEIGQQITKVDINFEIISKLGDKERKDIIIITNVLEQRVPDMLNASKKIADYNKEHPYELNLDNAINASETMSFGLNITNNGNGTLIYTLFDNSTDYYEMNFATTYKTYSCGDLPIDENVMQAGIELCLI